MRRPSSGGGSSASDSPLRPFSELADFFLTSSYRPQYIYPIAVWLTVKEGSMRTFVVLLVILFSPAFLQAAQIFGNIRKQGGPPVPGAVEINCGGRPIAGNADAYGAYSIFVPQQGKCALTIRYENKLSLPVSVFSYGDPTRYDFELLPSGELKRR
jgi:hypothetical protein